VDLFTHAIKPNASRREIERAKSVGQRVMTDHSLARQCVHTHTFLPTAQTMEQQQQPAGTNSDEIELETALAT